MTSLSYALVIASVLVVLQAAAGQQDTRLAQCRRTGWVFLPGIQQESWQAILNCVALTQPWITCSNREDCVGFTSNGNQGNGWMYRLPRAKSCGSGNLDNLSDLEWEWNWRWVPMKCKDSGPCCGTYIANDAGVDAAFRLTCDEAGGADAPPALQCPDKCPAIHTTHQYFSRSQFDIDCRQQTAAAGGGAGRRRHMLAAGPERVLDRRYTAAISKEKSGVPLSSQRPGSVEQQGTAQCLGVAKTCGTLTIS